LRKACALRRCVATSTFVYGGADTPSQTEGVDFPSATSRPRSHTAKRARVAASETFDVDDDVVDAEKSREAARGRRACRLAARRNVDAADEETAIEELKTRASQRSASPRKRSQPSASRTSRFFGVRYDFECLS
jgi:hypothetical protein